MRALCILLLSCLGCFGQAFTFADPTISAWSPAVANTNVFNGLFVDSVSGSDSNDGTTNSPFATLSKVISVTGGSSTTNIYLKRGSVFRESFSPPTNSYVGAYGTGAKPIISGAIVLTNANFALVSGQSNTYQYAYTPTQWTVVENGNTISCSNVCMVWDGETRMGRGAQDSGSATNLNMVITNSPSWFFDRTNHILYVHTSDNSGPTTNNRVYQASVRRLCIYGGDNFTMEDIQAEKGYEDTVAHSLGEFSGFGSATVRRCIFKQGYNHVAGVANTVDNKSPLIFDSCVFSDADPNGATGPTVFVAYKDGVTAPYPVTYLTNCSAYNPATTATAGQIGYFAHHSTAGSFSVCTMSNCYAQNFNYAASCGYPAEDLDSPIGFTAINCAVGIQGGSRLRQAIGLTTYNCTNGIVGNFTNINLLKYYNQAGLPVQINGSDTTNVMVAITNCLIKGTCTYGFYLPTYGLASSASNVISGVQSIYECSPVSGSNIFSYADYNTYYGAVNVAVGIPTNNTFSQWRAAFPSLDSHSVTTDPLISVPVYPTNYLMTVAADAPATILDPASTSVTVGTNATFSYTVAGIHTLYYQWLSSGTNITGENTSSYTKTNPQLTDSGLQISCLVTNDIGSITSAVATLTVTAPPAPVSPTNIVGYPNVGWWCVSSNYTTNATSVVLADLSGHAYDLTNSAATNTRPARIAAAVNGLDALFINNDQGAGNHVSDLRSAIYTSSQPHEVVMVLCLSNQFAPSSSYVFNSMNASFINAAAPKMGTGIIPYAGNTFTPNSDVITNKWFVLDVLFNTTLTVYTNNVAGGATGNGTMTCSGFTIGNRYDNNGPSSGIWGLVAEASTYSTNLSVTARSNLFNYYTNKYAISP